MTRALLLGHRGDPEHHPENTLPGLVAAVTCGADGVELDVQVSRDGVPVVVHDATLDRTAGLDARVDALDARQLDALGIPRLDAVLLALRAHTVAVELKPAYALYPELASNVLDIARRVGATRMLLLSFDHAHLAAARDYDPRATCAALVREMPRDPLALLGSCGARALAAWWELIDAELCARLRDAGRDVIAWTVDAESDAVALARMGVAAVISNRPCALASHLRAELGETG